jgi:hypothetical protein
MDDVPVDKVKDFQNKLTEFLTTRKEQLLAKILKEKALSDPLTAELKAAATEFKQTYQVPGQAPAAGGAQSRTVSKGKPAATEAKQTDK